MSYVFLAIPEKIVNAPKKCSLDCVVQRLPAQKFSDD